MLLNKIRINRAAMRKINLLWAFLRRTKWIVWLKIILRMRKQAAANVPNWKMRFLGMIKTLGKIGEKIRGTAKSVSKSVNSKAFRRNLPAPIICFYFVYLWLKTLA